MLDWYLDQSYERNTGRFEINNWQHAVFDFSGTADAYRFSDNAMRNWTEINLGEALGGREKSVKYITEKTSVVG